MKKGLSVILSLVLIITCLPFSVSARSKRYDCGDYSYTLKNGKATLRRYEGKGEKIFKIPSQLDGYPVVKIGVCAFEGIDFETVIIPEGVTTIDAAFYWCEALKTVKIPKTVTKIASRFSQECHNVANIEVDKDNAYYCDVDGVLFNKDKTKLIEYPPKKKDKSYNIPNGTKSICLHAFENSTSLENVTIPDSVKTIGKHAFWNSSIKSIKMSKNITRIGTYAFSGTKYWKNLDNWKNHGLYIDNYLVGIITGGVDLSLWGKRPDDYTITPGTKLIADSVFTPYDNLEKVTIPESVKYIGKNAFRYCENLTEFNVDSNNKYYCDIDGVLFNKKKTRLIRFPACKNTANYEIPKSVKDIDKNAFYFSQYLKSVTIPDSVTVLKQKTFYVCRKLKSIKLSKNLTKIGKEAFQYCNSLKSIKIPNSVTEIGKNAFDYCNKLKSVKLSKNLKKIGERAFIDCKSLTSIKIPNSVTEIGSAAFSGCKSLKTLKISKNIAKISASAFASCKTLESVTIPKGVKIIDKNAFVYCKAIKKVQLPNTLTEIGDRAFNTCTSLKSIKIPKNVTKIGEYALGYCKIRYDKYTTIENFKINGEANSTAQTYAKENGFKFSLI